MERDIFLYFEHYSARQTDKRSLRRTANQLLRAGIADMETLCGLLDRSPGTLRELRNIGNQSMEHIQAVCSDYRRNKTRSV